MASFNGLQPLKLDFFSTNEFYVDFHYFFIWGYILFSLVNSENILVNLSENIFCIKSIITP